MPMPAQPSSGACFRAASREAGPVGEPHGIPHVALEVAVVDGQAQRGLVRHRGRRHVVATTQLRRLDANLTGGHIDQALDHVGRLRTPGTPVGVDWNGVGEHALDRRVDDRNGVESSQRRATQLGRDRRAEGRHVCAEISENRDLEAEETAVCSERELGVGHVVAPVSVAEESFDPFRRPFDRATEHLRRPYHQSLLGIGELLHAEGAPDVARDHVEFLGGELEHILGQNVAHPMRTLGRSIERVAVRRRRVIVAYRRPRLHRVRHDAVVHEIDRGDMIGRGEGPLGCRLVAHLPVEADVVRSHVPHRRRSRLQSSRGVGDHG